MRKAIKLTIIVLTLFYCLAINVFAKNNAVSAVIPDYQIVIDDSSVYYADSIYPFLNYKGITYLPMTYEYSRAMNLTTGWLKGSAFMVAYQPSDEALPLYETTTNKKYNIADIPTGYNVYVNAKKVDNETAEYPILNFRGITYFPLTWEYVFEEFGWDLSFEENVLRINTEKNTDKRWSLVEKRENDAVLQLYDCQEISLGDGNFKSEFIMEYYNLDYKTGEITKLADYTPPETKKYSNEQIEVSVKDDGYVYYKENKLEDIYIEEAKSDFVKPDNVERTEYFVSASLSDVSSPLNVVSISVYTANYGKEGSWERQENYSFLKVDNSLISLGIHTNVENVYELEGNIFFNTVEYVRTISSHLLQNKKMWKLSKDGKLTEIRYGEYNSIIIIGKANNKLYLKCLWSPENYLKYAPYSVSLVNDGYHTFDGEGITFVSPYVYSDFDIVSGDGNIFAVNNKLDKIIKCEINPGYY